MFWFYSRVANRGQVSSKHMVAIGEGVEFKVAPKAPAPTPPEVKIQPTLLLSPTYSSPPYTTATLLLSPTYS